MFWTKIHDVVKPLGFAIGFIGVGMWVQSAHDGAASIPWFRHEASLAVVEKVHADCEHRRADAAKNLLVKSENGADVDDRALPNCPEPKK